jgi:hypothetical protein
MEHIATLKDYFENKTGFGVLATSDSNGKVDAAVYSRPHFMENGSLAFIMRDRLTHANLQSNPHAVFLFNEDSPGYKGKRLFLKKIKEDENSELIKTLRRRSFSSTSDEAEAKYLVYFEIEKVLPLIGAGEI